MTWEVIDDFHTRAKVFASKNKIRHVLTERDFLEQYKPYEPVYEYWWVLLDKETMDFKCIFDECATDEEMEWHIDNFKGIVYVKIVETKRERATLKGEDDVH